MAMRFGLSSFYRFIHRNWTAILSAIAVTGYVLGYELQFFQTHRELFMFMAANAVIWTLVELKSSLRTHRAAKRYPNMRAARSDVSDRIKRAICRRTPTSITIIGGRIRTISDMLREIVTAIQHGDVAAQNTTISVYCLHPEYLPAVLTDQYFRDAAAKRERLVGYGMMIRRFTAEIEELARLPELTSRNVKLQVVLYRSLPYLYCFVIDRSELYWGFFTWNADMEDFEGPSNPCFYYSSQAEQYDDLYMWLTNRAEFLSLTAR
jgi:hypothetical protein